MASISHAFVANRAPLRAGHPRLYPNFCTLESVLNPAHVTAAEIEARANRHKPSEPAQLAREMNCLLRQGLTARDVADAFRMKRAPKCERSTGRLQREALPLYKKRRCAMGSRRCGNQIRGGARRVRREPSGDGPVCGAPKPVTAGGDCHGPVVGTHFNARWKHLTGERAWETRHCRRGV